MTRIGIIKSDDVSYSYVFIAGQCWLTVWNGKEIVSSPPDERQYTIELVSRYYKPIEANNHKEGAT